MRVEPDTGPFAIVPDWLVDAVSAPAVVTWVKLWKRDSDGDRSVSEYQAELAKELGISDRQVRAHITELRDAGALTARRGGKGRPAIYILHTRKPDFQQEVLTGSSSPVRPEAEPPLLTEEAPEGPSSEPTAPPREDAGGVRALVAHFYDEATRLRMTVPQSMAPHIARQITDALAAGAPERDVKGGITLLLEKGRPPQSLPYLVAEWQATRRPVTREEKPHWDEEPYEPVLPPDEQLEAVRRLQERLSGAPTADVPTPGKDPPAATTKTSSSSTPTLEENPNEHDPEPER